VMGWHDGGTWEAAVWLPLCLAVFAVWVGVLVAAMSGIRAWRVREPAPPEDTAHEIGDLRHWRPAGGPRTLECGGGSR